MAHRLSHQRTPPHICIGAEARTVLASPEPGPKELRLREWGASLSWNQLLKPMYICAVSHLYVYPAPEVSCQHPPDPTYPHHSELHCTKPMTAGGSTVRIVGLLNSIEPSPCLFGSSKVHRPQTPVAGVWKKTLETKPSLSTEGVSRLAVATKLWCLLTVRGPYSEGRLPASPGRGARR